MPVYLSLTVVVDLAIALPYHIINWQLRQQTPSAGQPIDTAFTRSMQDGHGIITVGWLAVFFHCEMDVFSGVCLFVCLFVCQHDNF